MPDIRNIALAVLVTAGASSFVAFKQGENHERGRRAQVDLAASSAASSVSKSKDAEIASLTLAQAGVETTRQQAVREIRTNTREIIKDPVYLSVCLPPTAVGLLDNATAIANGGAGQGVAAPPSGPTDDSSASPAG